MKRRFALVAVVLIVCVGSQRSFAFCYDVLYHGQSKNIVVGDTRWILHSGVVYRHTTSTDALTVSQRKCMSKTAGRLPFAPIDRTSFPSLLHLTSKTTSLIEGPIHRILIDDHNRLWAFNEAGDASMFDGVSWENFLRQRATAFSMSMYSFDIGLDVAMKDGVIRIATPLYVDEIDMNRLERRRLLDINGRLESPRFLGMDTILSNAYDNIIFIDLVTNTIDIDGRIDTVNNSSYDRHIPRLLDVRIQASPIVVRRSLHKHDEYERRRDALHQQFPLEADPGSIHAILQSLQVLGQDTVYPCGWTPERTGAYLDMVADKNGTIYLAGFDGITVIPMQTEEDVVRDRPSTLAMATLYPNPATHHVTIGLNAAPAQRVSALIVDASGTTVGTADLQSPSTLLDLTSYPNGMYTVVLASDRTRVARSLIVQR